MNKETTVQFNVVYTLYNLQPWLNYIVLHHAIFRNPASGHRPNRGQLVGAIQDAGNEN